MWVYGVSLILTVGDMAVEGGHGCGELVVAGRRTRGRDITFWKHDRERPDHVILGSLLLIPLLLLLLEAFLKYGAVVLEVEHLVTMMGNYGDVIRRRGFDLFLFGGGRRYYRRRC